MGRKSFLAGSSTVALLLGAAPLLLHAGSLSAQTGSTDATAARTTFGPNVDTIVGPNVDTNVGTIVGTIVVAHGGSAEWNAPVFGIADETRTGGPIEVALLMGDSAASYRFQDAAARLVEQGAERIVVVPLLASSHSGHYEQIRYLAGQLDSLSESMMHHLHMSGIERPSVDVPITLTHSLDASMEIATILAERAIRLAVDPTDQALFIIGHGPNSAEDYAEWMANLRPVADSIARITGFADVKLGLVRDDAPDAVRAEAVRSIREIIELQHTLTRRPVVVVPLLISGGYVSRKLGHDLAGLDIAYDGAGLLPHSELARWIERRVREAPASAGVTDAPDPGRSAPGGADAAAHGGAGAGAHGDAGAGAHGGAHGGGAHGGGAHSGARAGSHGGAGAGALGGARAGAHGGGAHSGVAH